MFNLVGKTRLKQLNRIFELIVEISSQAASSDLQPTSEFLES